mgnify:CR=1 FL=1
MTGLGPAQIRRIGQLYRRRVPPERVVTHELARPLTELSSEINRQIIARSLLAESAAGAKEYMVAQ